MLQSLWEGMKQGLRTETESGLLYLLLLSSNKLHFFASNFFPPSLLSLSLPPPCNSAAPGCLFTEHDPISLQLLFAIHMHKHGNSFAPLRSSVYPDITKAKGSDAHNTNMVAIMQVEEETR